MSTWQWVLDIGPPLTDDTFPITVRDQVRALLVSATALTVSAARSRMANAANKRVSDDEQDEGSKTSASSKCRQEPYEKSDKDRQDQSCECEIVQDREDHAP